MSDRPPDDYLCHCPQCDTVAAVEMTRDDARRIAPGPLLWVCPDCGFEWLAPPDGVAYSG
jgi:methionine synthase II (cobalamin-independent)